MVPLAPGALPRLTESDCSDGDAGEKTIATEVRTYNSRFHIKQNAL